MIYYVQTNLIAILIAVVLLTEGRRTTSKNETSQIVMNYMLWQLILLSVCDIFAYCASGRNLIASQIFNTLFYLAIALGTYSWFVFILVKTNVNVENKKKMYLTSVPILLLCIALLTNPFTGFFFTIDEQVRYHRNTGIMISWIVEWGYMLAAFAVNLRFLLNGSSRYKRGEYFVYLFFALPLTAAAIAQMMFYGTTTLQIGFMMSLLMVNLSRQHFQMNKDALTGLNNKNAFLSFQDSLFEKSSDPKLTVFIIDADKFKLINDTYGHTKGDLALQNIADALKASLDRFVLNRISLFRYGGDEFLMVGMNMEEESICELEGIMQDEVRQINDLNHQKGEKYNLSISIGHATGICRDIDEFTAIIKQADANMYEIKKAKKAARD